MWLCINAEFSGGVFSSQLSVYVCVFVHVWGEEQEGGGVEGGGGFQLPAGVCSLPTSVPALAAK